MDSMCIHGGGKIMGWFIAYMSGDGTCAARVDGGTLFNTYISVPHASLHVIYDWKLAQYQWLQ